MPLFSKISSPTITRLLSTSLLVLLVVMTVFVALPQVAEAQLPFGGLSTTVFWCNCSFNLWITIANLAIPTTGPNFIYQPGATILYLFGQIYRPGVWLLGLAAPGGQCWIIVPHGCALIMTAPTMTIVGTSM